MVLSEGPPTLFVTDDGTESSFRGTYVEVERPTRIVKTRLFEGWPDGSVVSADLPEANGATKLTMKLGAMFCVDVRH
jgi:uncharacterized protein YndB with AHSA1/START domain